MNYNPVIIELMKILIVIDKELDNYYNSYTLYKEIYKDRNDKLIQLKYDIENIIKEYSEDKFI
jgi:hypothetical protein